MRDWLPGAYLPGGRHREPADLDLWQRIMRVQTERALW